MDRFDALADRDDGRLSALGGDALSDSPDEELQGIVAEVAAALDAPVALVSLVLKHTQIFRAQHGLPPDLASAGATDRDVSFCQFVVRDEAPLSVDDATLEPHLPQMLVERFGVRAYLGSPLEVGGRVVGSLCAMDHRPRTFTIEDAARLKVFAERASRRLSALAENSRHEALGRALSPALEEVRNIMTPMVLGIGTAETALAELGAFRRMALSSLGGLPEVPPTRRALSRVEAAHGDMATSIACIARGLDRLRDVVGALEAAVLRGEATTEAEDIAVASLSLAHHVIKLVGGVELVRPIPEALVSARRGPAVMFLSAVLSSVATADGDRKERGLKLTVRAREGAVRFIIDAAANGVEASALVERLSSELPEVDGVGLVVSGASVVVSMRRA